MLYIFVAMGFGIFISKVKPSGVLKFIVAVVLVVAMFAVGMQFPLYFDVPTWRYIVFGYCFIAAVLPMWLLMEPRDYLSSFLLLGMVAGGVIGVLAANPSVNMPAFVGLKSAANRCSQSSLSRLPAALSLVSTASFLQFAILEGYLE